MFVSLVLIGLFVISPFEAAETVGNVNKTRSRQPRHYWNLYQMTMAVTGRNPRDFTPYGRYCGPGNQGETLLPVDKIDECCRYHDACYDVAKREPCKHKAAVNEDIDKLQNYRWNIDNKTLTIECEDYGDLCKTTLCECDSTVAGCLKLNLDSYNASNWRERTSNETAAMIYLYYQEKVD